MPSMIFFGAGASKPFGIPTMQEMVNEFEEKLGKEYPELYQYYIKIKNSLISEYGESQIDIESMFSVIQGIANKTEPKDLGHFAFYHMTKISQINNIESYEIELAKQVQNELEKYIKKTCGHKLPSSQSTEVYKKSYIPLFSVIEGDIKKYHNEYDLVHDWKAFTTNYDSIFERFWHSFEEPLDHFNRVGNSNVLVFGRKNLATHSLSKLHGSLDWTKNVENGDIIRRKESSFDTVKTEGNVLLFPIQQKDMYLHPWFTLFQDLKNGLLQNPHWYVIRYAFNDPFIFNVFEETLAYGSAKLTIINPDAVKIKEKFTEKNRKYITPLPIKFGDDYFEQDFNDFNRREKILDVEIKGETEYFGLNIPSGIADVEIKDTEGFISQPSLIQENGIIDKMELHANKKEKNSASFQLFLKYDYSPETKIELIILTKREDPVEMTITNQGRLIDTFTTNS